MKKFILILLIIILAVSIPVTFAADSLNNTTDITKAISDAHTQNKSLMLVFDQDNCVYCDMFKKDVLSKDNVISELNDDYITVIIDINKNPEIASEYNVFGTPTMIFLDSNQNQIGKIEGYVGADEFLNTLKGM